jgi:hypothetical protein
MKTFRLKSSLWLTLTFALCVQAQAASAKALRFVYFQGFLSCTLSNRAPVQKFLEVSKNHPDARVYWGCFDGGFVQHAQDWHERFFLYTIEPNGQWSEPLEMNARTAPQEIALMIRKELRELEGKPSFDNTDAKLMDVFVAGHSHGGWMAMRTAYHIGLVERAQIQQVLTIDPVSFDLCHSSWFPVSAVQNTFRWWGEPHDCHRAPRDLEPIAPFIASAAGNRWVNIYENTMPYLSSGPMKGAPINKIYYSQTNFDWFTAHRAILLDETTWKNFYHALESSAYAAADDEQSDQEQAPGPQGSGAPAEQTAHNQ